mmetsp:Transcript_72292/g.130088  ORF Transcript_72292/g.130088 Transcript_72292/m.130088 type:complete len:593 (+) Transcript_72292:138-1916(+)|eukprot:CAMPEP_0115087962 /NCGR_PEP_ID=MMETSP0227-20121206/23673_1 /TAXON_ID=89957 /ORGANISM="Polarella glacialis, Strain CCMP 1383" /LENGTH=592 /DNA_ID=CAMNT_0002478071 /DNA_START=136 /DNA_END=1914 /DNA_ORIENTATION=+
MTAAAQARPSSQQGFRRPASAQDSGARPATSSGRFSGPTGDKPLTPRVPPESEELSRPQFRRKGPGQTSRKLPTRTNQFTITVERTVDKLKGNAKEGNDEDLQRILSDIRKQYDEVHREADRREEELIEVRRSIRLLEADAGQVKETYCGFTREGTIQKFTEAADEVQQADETKKVYQHLVERLQRELRITQQKVHIMQTHLDRKTREVEKRQDYSRRVHEDKVEAINNLEEMELDIHLEREVCTDALNDLENSMSRRRTAVREREEFERWRYETALMAATEAFEGTAGRFRKTYAIEKLTGNCLQKLTFEQAEQSQATEDGFQKIREVTGLTDVMDIVHKFLNRDTEHEQLRSAVREAEVRLNSLREAEASRNGEDALIALEAKPGKRGLATEIAAFQHILEEARRDHSEIRRRLKNGTLLIDSVMRWVNRVGGCLRSFDQIEPCQNELDIPEFFKSLVGVVERFLEHAHNEMPDSRLVAMTAQATSRAHSDQQRLMTDKDFLRANCRIPASLDQRQEDEKKKRGGGAAAAASEDERLELEYAVERDRLKQEAQNRFSDRELRPKPSKSSRELDSSKERARTPSQILEGKS